MAVLLLPRRLVTRENVSGVSMLQPPWIIPGAQFSATPAMKA